MIKIWRNGEAKSANEGLGRLRLDDLFGYLKPQEELIARRQYNNEQTPEVIGESNRE